MSNLIRPFDLFDEFDRVYGRLFDREPPRTAGPTSEGLPPVDISETPEGYVIEMEVPGLRAGEQLIRPVDVIRVTSGTRNESTIFLAPNRRAYAVFSHGSPLDRYVRATAPYSDRIASAPAFMALTIFW